MTMDVIYLRVCDLEQTLSKSWICWRWSDPTNDFNLVWKRKYLCSCERLTLTYPRQDFPNWKMVTKTITYNQFTLESSYELTMTAVFCSADRMGFWRSSFPGGNKRWMQFVFREQQQSWECEFISLTATFHSLLFCEWGSVGCYILF